MKIELENSTSSSRRISAYSSGRISIDEKDYTSSLVLSAHSIEPDWPPADVSELKPVHFNPIIAMEPEIVILGTGSSLVFPAPHLLTALYDKNIGIEVMDTGAACRSYNFLLGEGREVVAALIMIR